MAVTVDCAADTVPAFTTTVAVWVTPIPSIVAEIVFDSASVDASVPVATPLAFVVAAGCVSVLPPPVADRITVAPATGLSSASRAVTVIVEALAPLEAAIGDVAATLEWPPETVLAVTTTVAVCVMATELIVAETVFDSASVDESVPVATPLAFVVVAGCVSVLPDPVAASTTVAAWVIATASIVADTVFEPAAVALRVPVATPLASVVPTGWVNPLPALGVTASVTVAP